MVDEDAEQPRAARDDAPYEDDNEELAPRNLNFGATQFDVLPRLLAVDIRRWRSRSVLSEQPAAALCGRSPRTARTMSLSSTNCGAIRAHTHTHTHPFFTRTSQPTHHSHSHMCTRTQHTPPRSFPCTDMRARGHTVNHTNTCTQVSGGNTCAAAVRTGCGASLGTAAPHYAVARRPRRGDVERQPRPACRDS